MNNFKHKDTETVGNVHIVLKLKKDDVVVWLSDKVDLKCVTHVATLGWASCHPLSKGLHSAASNVSTIKNNRTVFFFNKESTLLSMTKKIKIKYFLNLKWVWQHSPMLHFMTLLQPWFRTHNMNSLHRVCCHTAHTCELSGGQRTTLDAVLRNAIHLLVTRSLFSLELTNEARLRILHLSQRDFGFELGS